MKEQITIKDAEELIDAFTKLKVSQFNAKWAGICKKYSMTDELSKKLVEKIRKIQYNRLKVY